MVSPMVIRQLGRAIILGSLVLPAVSAGIDNPDTKDRVAAFKQRAQPYQVRINEQAETTQEYISAYAAYEAFLEKELDRAYQSLRDELSDDKAAQLAQSQQAWRRFRKREQNFIEENWTQENFGTSSHVSRGAYRTRLLKQRVISLLHYLNNY